jgi:hypothetical protein
MEKSVTISCRVTPDLKMKLAQRSEKLGMKLCNFIELLVLNQFEDELKIVENHSENELTFQSAILAQTDDSNQVEIFNNQLKTLKERYEHEGVSETQIVNACLVHAVENHRAFIQRNLSVFLNRLKDGKYDA